MNHIRLWFLLSIIFSYSSEASELNLQDVGKAVEMVHAHYVKPIASRDLYADAIAGMLAQIDEHAVFLDAKDLSDLDEFTQGSFSGIGAEFVIAHKGLRLIASVDDSPAARAGLLPGDLIVAVNQVNFKMTNPFRMIHELRGMPGTVVRLTLIRNHQPISMSIRRSFVHWKSIRSHMIHRRYGYIRISAFQDQTAHEFVRNFTKIKTHAKGLIIDLRKNPGGVLDSAIDIANCLLDKEKLGFDGRIVSTEGRLEKNSFIATANNRDITQGLPIVLLIDRGSASAAEVLALCLKEHKRAILVGERTFGKGSVQSVLSINDDHAIKMTTAFYYGPSGQSIEGIGIEPDVLEKQNETIEHHSLMARKPEIRTPTIDKELLIQLENDPALKRAIHILQHLIENPSLSSSSI